MPVIKIRTRTGAGAASGPPAQLAAGELAFNVAGTTTNDKQGGGGLFIGNGSRVVTLVSSQRQVEVTGNQTIKGLKTFHDGIALGTSGVRYPTIHGQSGEIIRMNPAGDKVVWGPAIDLTVHHMFLTGTNGSVEDNLNNSPNPLSVGTEELWIISDQESGNHYLWLGGKGTFGTAAGGTAATAFEFALMGTSHRMATAAEVQQGTDANKIIAPAVAKSELFRTQAASGNQVVTVPLTTFKEAVAGDGNGKTAFESDVSIGAAGAPVTITAFAGSTLTGEAANPLKIQEAVIDCGTY